MPVLKGCQTRG